MHLLQPEQRCWVISNYCEGFWLAYENLICINTRANGFASADATLRQDERLKRHITL